MVLTPGSDNSSISAEQVKEALKKVNDPVLKKNIVDLGQIDNLTISGTTVRFELIVHSKTFPIRHELKEEARAAVAAIAGVETVEAEISKKVISSRIPLQKGLPGVKHIIAVSSGKGGVGKSTATVNLACALKAKGYAVGILDADIYGPNIPIMMGLKDATLKGMDEASNKALLPEGHGIKVMSVSFLVKPDQAMIWRGPILHKSIGQFFSDMAWGELDYLLIDLPPGTGDAQLSITQLATLSGGIIVTTPQDVSLADCKRATTMFRQTNVPVLGVIENMSYYVNRHGEREDIFGEGGGERLADELGLSLLAQVPLLPQVRQDADAGQPIVLSNPESEPAKQFMEAAEKMVVAVENAANNPQQPEEASALA